jgi:hypothetical protein
VSLIAILGGSYWLQQLLLGVESWQTGDQWTVPKHHGIGNVLQESKRREIRKANLSMTKNISYTTQQHTSTAVPPGLQSVLKRAMENRMQCNYTRPPNDDTSKNASHLPHFGIIEALDDAYSDESNEWQCQVPPETECDSQKFTVIFMGYRPDRLGPLKNQVFGMTGPHWNELVEEVLLVWNGEGNLTFTKEGQALDKLATERDNFRIFFPLQQGFSNDLMNRYHPRMNITTKAILFYDDDGPFYTRNAILGGFELWKRNANAQIGAMARRIDLTNDVEFSGDRQFIRHCPGDVASYNYHEFANYHARMVLPSGSFLHSNYLCFLWHPVFEPIRAFVRAHPVHPDDVTVSTIVSQIAGRAPKVYSRRINTAKEGRRRLQRTSVGEDARGYPRRRLLWDDVSKEEWANMRSSAVSSLTSYFGSINSGSVGWCHDTAYSRKEKEGYVCDPLMARVGMLPWMTADHKPKDNCS